MIKLLFSICTTILVNNSCKNFKTQSNKRDIVIANTINALSKNDTLQLYNLVDTSYCFKIYGKEGFNQRIKFINDKFNICGFEIAYTLIKEREKKVNSREYILPFCRNNQKESYFELLLTFADFKNDDKILFLDVKKPIKYPQQFKPLQNQ